ncbi:MAG: zinc-dependent metalloprotease, partial [Ornithinimicrobium sp.]
KQVGTEGFNQVWSSPDALPRASEIADPSSWVARVHR